VHSMLGGQVTVRVTSYEMELQSTLNLPAGPALNATDWTSLNNQLALQFNVSAGNAMAAAARRRLRTIAHRSLQGVSNTQWSGVVIYTVTAAKDITGTLPSSLSLRVAVAGALGMNLALVGAASPATAKFTTTLAYTVTMNETAMSGRSAAAISSLRNSTAVTTALSNVGVTVSNVVTTATLGNEGEAVASEPEVVAPIPYAADDDDTDLLILSLVIAGVVLLIISVLVFRVTKRGKAQKDNGFSEARRGGNVFEVAQEFTANPVGVDSQLPVGWLMKVDQRSGREYYCNTVTRTTTWERPSRPAAAAAAAPVANSAAAGQWRAKQDPQGNTYYVNPTTRQSKWRLPPGAVLVGGDNPDRGRSRYA